MGKLYVGNSGSTPAIIKIEEVPKIKFGANVDTFIGDVDENGVLNEPIWIDTLNFVGVKTIGRNALLHKFYFYRGITSVDLSSVQNVDQDGLDATFQYCYDLKMVI